MMDCEHKSFRVLAKVNRLTHGEDGPVYAYTADIKVECGQCGTPFSFRGLPMGSNMESPTINADGTELRVPLFEGIGGIFTERT